MKCEVKHNGDIGIGHLWLIMGGAFMTYGCGYGLNGWGSYHKVSCCFVWKYAQKMLVLVQSVILLYRLDLCIGFMFDMSY